VSQFGHTATSRPLGAQPAMAMLRGSRNRMHAPGCGGLRCRHAAARIGWVLFILSAGIHACPAMAADEAAVSAVPFAVRVMIVNMFELEAAPWRAALRPDVDFTVPGLPGGDSQVHCTRRGVCQMTTGMGHANAAASMMAVLYSSLLELHRAYFIVAGIGGIDPRRGTLGSAAWARYAVDGGLAHEIDARELPEGWHDGYFGIYTDAPDRIPKFDYQTEVFQLDEGLLRRAMSLSRQAALEDGADLQAYRRRYHERAARQPPAVIQCDTLSGDTWWSGRRLGEHARRWTRLLTHGAATYCTTQQEDNATLNALSRAAQSGLIDMRRVALLRTGADFDRPYAHQGVFESMRAQRALAGAVPVATHNLVRAAMPLIEEITGRWDEWADGVPAD